MLEVDDFNKMTEKQKNDMIRRMLEDKAEPLLVIAKVTNETKDESK